MTKLQHSSQAEQGKVDEKNVSLVKESESEEKANESLSAINKTSIPVQETEKIETLIAEVENLKVILV